MGSGGGGKPNVQVERARARGLGHRGLCLAHFVVLLSCLSPLIKIDL